MVFEYPCCVYLSMNEAPLCFQFHLSPCVVILWKPGWECAQIQLKKEMGSWLRIMKLHYDTFYICALSFYLNLLWYVSVSIYKHVKQCSVYVQMQPRMAQQLLDHLNVQLQVSVMECFRRNRQTKLSHLEALFCCSNLYQGPSGGILLLYSWLLAFFQTWIS